MTPALVFAMALGGLPTEAAPGLFGSAERGGLVEFWSAAGRWRSEDAEAGQPWRPVFSPAASEWLLGVYKARAGGGRVMPTREPAARSGRERVWDDYIARQSEQDLAWARGASGRLNSAEGSSGARAGGLVGGLAGGLERVQLDVPADLAREFGVPPVFFVVSRPQRVWVDLGDFTVALTEGVEVRRTFPYFRAVDGVSHAGSAGAGEMAAAVAASGIPVELRGPVEQVARLEGGFDSVNTYDTGGVSVGLLQFAALRDGRGPLARLLASYRALDAEGFRLDFRRFGVDVAGDGRLVVVDPATGLERAGADAVRAVVRDKRLTAVFARAGRVSAGFRAHQLRVAWREFDPRVVGFVAVVNGVALSGRAGEVVRSSAGLATLMDRYVNTGSLSGLGEAVASVMAENGWTSLAQARGAESQVVARMVYREDFGAMALASEDSGAGPGGVRPSGMAGSLSGLGPPREGAGMAGGLGRGRGMELGGGAGGAVPPMDPGQFGALPPGAGMRVVPRAGGEGAGGEGPGASSAGSGVGDPGARQAAAGTPARPSGPITVPGG